MISSKLVLYLIDGSSQMYRAYHAPVRTAEGGLLRNAQGRRPTPSTSSSRCCASCSTSTSRSSSPRRSICRAARSATISSPTTRPTARRCPTSSPQQIPMVHAACEALGVPILTSERYEADDVIGTLAMKAAAAGLRRGDRHRRQGLLSAGRATASASTTRATRAPGTTPTGVKEKFGVTPEQVVDVLALMGDTIDNIKGVPGIGEKGARELIAQYGSLENLLAHAAEVQEQALPRRRCSRNADDARAEPRARAHPHRRAGGVRPRGAALPRRIARARASRSSTSSGSARSSRSTRRPPTRSTKTYRDRQHRRRACGALAERLRAAGRVRAARAARPAVARCAPRSSASRSRPRRATADYVPARPPGARPRPRACRVDAALDALRPLLEDEAVEESRPRSEVRRHRAGAPRRRRCAGSTSTRCWRATCSTRRAPRTRSRISRSSTPSYKALTEEDVCGRGAKAISLADVPVEAALDYAGERADLRRPARADASRRCSAKEAARRASTRRSSGR